MSGLWTLALLFLILIFRERREKPMVKMTQDSDGFYYRQGERHNANGGCGGDRDIEDGVAAVYTWEQYREWQGDI
jgi:hypothetical protein